MNYLAHLLLSEDTDEARIGSLLADFINISNSSLPHHFSTPLCDAVITHRKIDQFTDSHSDTMSSIQYFFPKFRHFSRIIVDILYDHFLSVHWNLFSNQSLDSFVENMYRTFENLPEEVPSKFSLFASNMIRYDILRAYLTIEDLHEVLYRVDKRLKNPPGLHLALDDCMKYYTELTALFLHFFPELSSFVQQQTPSSKQCF